jgi:L-malate glycosyltransferase
VSSSAGGRERRRLLVTVTFNDNQLRAHLLPILALPEVEEVVLVADTAPAPLPKVRVVVPPPALTRLVGRAIAKLLLCVWIAHRERPDWVVGFNLVPHGFNAIVAARSSRSRSLYTMIGGDREWLEGGWASDNNLLGRLSKPTPLLERLLLRVVRRSTRVAAMGGQGRRALVTHGVDADRVLVIPPAVEIERFARRPDASPPNYDVITVGALLPNKRTADLIRVAAVLARHRANLRVAVVGDGPLERELRDLVHELDLGENVEFLGFRTDLEILFTDAKLFVLASAYEGLSVAMLEAMASGLPAVVTCVGELAEFVRDGETGRLFTPGDLDALAAIVAALLDDEVLRASIGAAAAADVRSRVGVDVVARDYRALLTSASPEDDS